MTSSVHPDPSPHRHEQTRGPAPEANEEIQALVSEMLPHMAAGIAVLGTDLSISSWNSRAEDLTGYSVTEATRTGLLEIFEPAEVMQHVVRKVQAGIPTLSEYLHLRHAAGHLVPVTVQCSPQRHTGQSDCEIVVAFRELAPLHERLRDNEHLQMLGRLASSLSHEIRNPLNAIFLHVDILEEELRQPAANHQEQVAESLTEIKAEIARLNDLVQDYLSLARLSDLQREPTDLGRLVEDFGLEQRAALEARRVTLHLQGLSGLGQALLHRNAFRRVLLNLLQNALDAMPQGGGTVSIGGQRQAGQIRLEVSDTGNGIAQDQLPLLFTPFHTTKPAGTGLGLYVVQQILKTHDGSITVSSEPGSGTTFTILLPAVTSAQSPHN